jgi:hypothetical protein
MSPSLPRHPNVDLLKKQAKMLLAAQRRGALPSCELFRRLGRFSSQRDEEILGARVSLAEAQVALAIHYGHRSWKELIDEASSYPPSDEFSLAATRGRSEEIIPDYAGAGVPLGVVAALNQAGVGVGFMEFAAASGWAFSFGYLCADISPAHMAVRGKPGSDGPLEVFAFLPQEYGLGYEHALTSEPDRLWSFVRQRVDSGVAIMSEHMDGGLISSYREKRGRRQLFFDGTPAPGWIDVDELNPYAVYAFGQEREAKPQGEIHRTAIRRALAKGREHDWQGVPQGMAALREYFTDVSNPSKDFSESPEWFCWAAFERLMARRCCEVWLRSIANSLSGDAKDTVATAAGLYGEAFRHYELYLAEVRGCDPSRPTLWERARSPERIKAATPHLEQAIAEETSGLDALEEALDLFE